jgi:hypothetical protein
MSYFDLHLDDDTTVQVRKLPAKKRGTRTRADSRTYKGRKALFGTVFPTVSRRRQRKLELNWSNPTRDLAMTNLNRNYSRTDVQFSDYAIAKLKHLGKVTFTTPEYKSQ